MIVRTYTGEYPFAEHLKIYFSQNKQHGARDRKEISALCYGYYRMGAGVIAEITLEQKIELGRSLVYDSFNDIHNQERPNNISRISVAFDYKKIFPFSEELSKDIDKIPFNISHLIQPLLFIRVRPGKKKKVVTKLQESGIPFREISDSCLALPNRTQLQGSIQINSDVVIQDMNSQNIQVFFDKAAFAVDRPIHVWDCCAASGGKSLLAVDYFKNIKLTVSDIRKSILQNLKKRFHEAGARNYIPLCLDLSRTQGKVEGAPFDLIIADVPCSGSGTWSRTPEQLSNFRKDQIYSYAKLQQDIVGNVIPHLIPDGYLLYITCSVFARENEENIQFLSKQFNLKVIEMNYLKGYESRSDTLFAALLKTK